MRSAGRARMLIGVAVVLLPAAAAGQGSGRETAGWHLLRPGESLDSVAHRYLGARATGQRIAARNPGAAQLPPGARLLIQLDAGLPPGAAILTRLGGRVEAQPTPVDWLRGRRFDLLLAGDGLRTFAAGSAEVSFADSTRLVVSEDSLVFLRGAAARRAPADRPGEIEIVSGQADVAPGVTPLRRNDTIEIVLGAARARTRPDRGGRVQARARHAASGGAQLMVYRGTGEVAAAGRTVRLAPGTGTRVAPGSPPAPAERLLPAPTLRQAAARQERGSVELAWGAVEGAAGYTFELCRDPDCGELVARRVGLRDRVFAVADLAGGRYFWRVTAVTASGLDGFPSPSAELRVLAEWAAGRLAEQPTGGDADPADPPESARPATLPLVAYDEIEVRPSRVTLLTSEPVAPLALSRDEILALPHLGDDIFRALPLLPGTTANDVAAQFHVRGGRRDEVLVRLDGQELYGAYHLKDYDNALSIVAPESLASVELLTGGLPAAQGDRMGGLLDMVTERPGGGPRTRLGVGLLTAQASTAGIFDEGRGHWLATGRRGTIDLAGRAFGNEDPRYWDLLATAGYTLADRHTLRGHALFSGDRLRFSEHRGDETKERETRHGSSYLWLTHQLLIGNRGFVDSRISWSRIHSDRRAQEHEEEQQLAVADRRDYDVAELAQDWSLQLAARHFLTAGAALRSYEALYDYANHRHFDTPLAALRVPPRDGDFAFRRTLTGTHTSAYLSDRARLAPRLVLEAGLRWDRYSWRTASHGPTSAISPRLNLAWSLGERSVLRASWGRFAQSQRPYELLVEDGETQLLAVERSVQWLVGVEHVVAGRSPTSPLAGLALRLEAYRRAVDQPRRRYENLYEPYNVFPELEPDRIRVSPERSLARGVEVFVRGPARRIGWWLTYGYAKSEDRIAGRWVPRQIDQTHTVTANLDLPLGRHWRLDLAWRYHTGWPTTALMLREELIPDEPDDDGGEGDDGPGSDGATGFTRVLVPVLGPLHGARLDDYHRLDLRASRELRLRSGKLTLFFDVQNVYHRRNHSGFDMEVDEEAGALRPAVERWPGIVPSLGISWEL